MRRCLELAQRAKGQTTPNPMVGAVLVYEGRIIGEGWHQRYGAAHAEVNCLDSVVEADRGFIPESTMYVNLEPCAHYGNTPPCAMRLVQERVKKVVIANSDPFAKVSGRGVAILKEGGVAVEIGMLANEGRWLNRRFFCYHQLRRPYVVLKWAKTRNGWFAPLDGSRFQITNAASMQVVHKWRTEEAAILVGTHTALTDNPMLTARLWHGRQPLRVVLDRKLKVPSHHEVCSNHAPTWIVNDMQNATSRNVELVKMDFDASFLTCLMDRLYDSQIVSLIVEGGAQTLNQFIVAGMWDEARVLTGTADFPTGISAPILPSSTLLWASQLDGDLLEVFVNTQNEYRLPEYVVAEL